jgi:transcription factor WhiB
MHTTGRVEMSERLKFGVPRNDGNLTLDRSSGLNVVRTENQVRPHDGFKPEAVMVSYPIRMESEVAERTMQLARPPGWTEAPGLPCTPTMSGFDLTRKFMDRWDTSSEAEARALCAGCPVRPECLAAAIEEEHGLSANNRYLVRGGLTPAGRVRLEKGLAS